MAASDWRLEGEWIKNCNCAFGLYGAFFVKGASRHFASSFAFHSFVRPAPRAFFRRDRIFP
jgi:hypothetical protein